MLVIKEVSNDFEALTFKHFETEEGEMMQSDKFDFYQNVQGIVHIFELISKLYSKWNLTKHDREYRKKFTKAYRSMYDS